MSLSFLDNVDYNGKKPNFNRDLFDTVAQMKAFSENYLPDVFIASCKADGKQYVYNKNNTVDETTGKWRLLTSGGSGGGAVDSVNGKTGAVTLTASDVGALADSTDIPSKTSDLTNDSNFVSDANYQHTDNNFTNSLKTAYDGAVTDKHSHNNKTVLDAITSEVKSGYDSAVTNSHSHDNKAVIDKFTESAEGKPLYDGNAIGGSGGTTIVVGNGGDSYYSEDEIVIGSYLGKPLYRKVVHSGELGSGAVNVVVDNDLVMDKVINLGGYAIFKNGNHVPIPTAHSTSSYTIAWCNKEGKNIALNIGSSIVNNYAITDSYLILDYTKTTDTANSSPIARPTVYSTDEVCIGTYKGKPLYRRIIEKSSLVSGDNYITLDFTPTKLVNSYGTMFSSDNSTIKLPYNCFWGNAYSVEIVGYFVSNNSLRVRAGDSVPSSYKNFEFVLEYTKN